MAVARMIKQLNWTEQQLPQKVRTKHVHSLHQYFGKFVPQLVDYFLKRDLKNSKLICDPFMGSGTTLIESNVNGINSIGLDISKFNVMMCRVKTNKYDMDKLAREIDAVFKKTVAEVAKTDPSSYIEKKNIKSTYLNTWYHQEALHPLLIFRDIIEEHKYQDVMKIILSRSARSSRMIAHYEVDHPKHPYDEDYHCFKHDRICHPTKNSMAFLKRYCKDVLKRIGEFQKIRTDVYTHTIHGDSTTFDLSNIKINDVFTSPPYIGLIDYHEQHRYAYELLGIDDNGNHEIGSRKNGVSKSAISDYKKSISKTIKNITESSFEKNGSFIIIVNDKMNLYDDIIADTPLIIKKRLCREVNRRSGRRATRYNEDILVCKLDAA